jgi:F-type H+-transporting ATPase subunit epsilon
MDNSYDLNILAPDKVLFSGKVTSLVVPSEAGYLGVMKDHATLMATLGAGTLIARPPEGPALEMDVTGGGFIEVMRNKVTILLGKAATAPSK